MERPGNCGTCQWFLSYAGKDGRCYRFPPNADVPGFGAFGSERSVHPVVNEFDWCGEFQPSTNKAEEGE